MDNLSEIIDIFAQTTDRREMRSLFEDLFTEAERTDIAKRWYRNSTRVHPRGRSQRRWR